MLWSLSEVMRTTDEEKGGAAIVENDPLPTKSRPLTWPKFRSAAVYLPLRRGAICLTSTGGD